MKYISRIFKGKNTQGMSMAELCLHYLPKKTFGGFFGNPDIKIRKLEMIARSFDMLDDEEMYESLTTSYGLSDEEAEAFVQDSKSYRKGNQTIQLMLLCLNGMTPTQVIDIVGEKKFRDLMEFQGLKSSQIELVLKTYPPINCISKIV